MPKQKLYFIGTLVSVLLLTSVASAEVSEETAYILKNSYKSFPEGSIHIVGVDSELSSNNKHIAMELDNHYRIYENCI